MTDLISRADIPCHTQLEPMGNGQYSDVEVAYKTDIDALPSAEAVHIETYRELYEKYVKLKHASAEADPIVIRAKTFMRKEDFDKWAEDIKKQNKSIVCIPCDAEVVSADRPQGEWIFNPTDAIDLMFAKPKCSKCGFESSDGGNFCPNCGARMKGGAE